jgi:hypothetical protein
MLCQRCTIIGSTENVLGVLTGISNCMKGLSAEAKVGRVGASFQSFAAVGGALAAGSGAAMASVERGDGKVHIPGAGGSLSETANVHCRNPAAKRLLPRRTAKRGACHTFWRPLDPLLDEHRFRSLGKLVVCNLDRIADIDDVGD